MEQQEYKFCTKCGAKMPKDAKFCTSCGAAFNASTIEKNETVIENQKPVEKDSGTTGSAISTPVSPAVKNKSKAPIFIAIGAIAIIVIAAIVFFMGSSSIKYDDDLVGSGELMTSVEGLEELDDSTTDKIVEAINEKYGNAVIKTADISLNGEMMINASDDASGISMDMGGSAEGQITVDIENRLMSVLLSGNINLFGMDMPLEVSVYEDGKEGLQYSNYNVLGEESGWTTEEIEKSDDDSSTVIELDRELVKTAYRVEGSGAYVLEADLMASGVEDNIEDAASEFAGTADDSFIYDNMKAYVTLDEGLGIIGMYIDMSDCIPAEDGISLNSFYLSGLLNSMNEAVDISMPYENGSAESGIQESTASQEYNTPILQTSDIFVDESSATSWSNTYDLDYYTAYYMIPVNEDGTNRIYFCSSNTLTELSKRYYMDAERIEQTSAGGFSAIGTMYSYMDSSYNGIFKVTWESVESVDWAMVEATDGTEMTDIDMAGDYRYYGYVETPSEAAAIDTSEYIFYDSDKRYLNAYDVEGMDEATIRLAINEIYARHGRAFKTEDLNEYFSSKSWYTPLYSQEEFTAIEDSVFNEYEKENIKYLAGIRDGLSTGFTANWMYGTYEIHNESIDAIAEIGWYSDSGEDYINLSGATSSGSAVAEFSGVIFSSKSDRYQARDEYGNIIDFTYNGIDSIEIISGQISDSGMGFPGFEGTYQKMTEFSNNAG